MAAACKSRSKIWAWQMTYPSSAFFALLDLVLRAFSALLPAPGRTTEERGGSGASARTTEDQRDPRRKRRGFFDGRDRWPRLMATTKATTEGQDQGHDR